MANFLMNVFDPCSRGVMQQLLTHKRNCSIACDLSESQYVNNTTFQIGLSTPQKKTLKILWDLKPGYAILTPSKIMAV